MGLPHTHHGKLECYVPRVVLRRLAAAPGEPVLTLDGTAVFGDISGFMRPSERLARTGDEGTEERPIRLAPERARTACPGNAST